MNHVDFNPSFIEDRNEVNELVNKLMKCVKVNYEVILKSNTVVCTAYLFNKEAKQRFFICTGTSSCFFEQAFDLALGEKYSYEEAMRTCRTKLYEFVYFYYFINQGVKSCFSNLKSTLVKLDPTHLATLASST